MDPYSSGEKFNIKTRKPYTITKQRERWTEDEHNSFLEALKLYGRAWQRIEEHIGTKTAVQIRSHAQKFFTKLEKEALAKGVPIKQALDMEIPPPRPKRKPNYPYPRKTGPKNHPHLAAKDRKQATEVSPLQSGIQIQDLERKPFPEQTTTHQEKLEDAKTSGEMENGTEGSLLSKEAPCVSLSSENENSVPRSVAAVNPGIFREFIPALEVINHDETNESYITTVETSKHQKSNQGGIKHTNSTSNTSLFAGSDENIIEGGNSDKELSQPGNFGNDIRGVQNYPRHVPVQVVEGNQGVAKNSVPPDLSFQESTLNNKLGEVNEHPNLVVNIAASANTGHYSNASRSSSYQTVPSFHPLFTTQFCDNQENYRSLLHVSSNISSLIVSSLLQNPAAHAAASFAATFWHPGNTEASSGDSSARDHPSVQLNSETPSMAAIAAATVAAATAWWAAHGLLPVCTPFYPGYSCTSPFSFGTPIDNNIAREAINGREKAHSEDVLLQSEKMDAEKTPQDLPKEHPPSESLDLSSSEDSDGREDMKSNTELSPVDTKEMTPVAEPHDSSKTNVRKQVDRSSCGSNTTSGSEIETDALEKHGEEKEETKGSDVNLPCNDSNSRRSRSTISPNESWKEVSEEGRLAFQALFSREVLPQSFSDRRTIADKDPHNIVKNSEAVSQLDLNRMTCSSQEPMESNAFALLRSEKNVDEGLLTMGLGGGMKLNVHHTGFKPYKRCSVEATISKIVSASTGSSQNDEKGPKRMRLEAEAST